MNAILDARGLRVLEAPSVEELLSNSHPLFPFDKTFEGARSEPLVLPHTSGTTALPKPNFWTHDFAASYIVMAQLDPPEDFENLDRLWQGNRLFSTLPPFHVSYISL